MFSKKKPLDRNGNFEVKDSYAMLMIMLGISVVFTALFAYFVSPRQAGWVYYFIIGMLLMVVFVFAFKAMTIRTSLLINKKGIYFAQKRLFVRWSQVKSAGFQNVKPDDENEDLRLMVYYFPPKDNNIALVSFKVTTFMNQSESEVEEALSFYFKGH